MAKRGISGVALLLTGAGAWLVYVGVRDVPPIGGLREILTGTAPAGRATSLQFDAGASSAQELNRAAALSGATGNLVTVHGIRVDSSLKHAVETLVAGARPNLLSGGGWRSSEAQRELRRTNGCTCDNTSRCCRVPTAPVGQSMHERGLAIDFSWNGTLIRSRESAGFRFLQANAPGVGLQNLPSEPWHWSTNGR